MLHFYSVFIKTGNTVESHSDIAPRAVCVKTTYCFTFINNVFSRSLTRSTEYHTGNQHKLYDSSSVLHFKTVRGPGSVATLSDLLGFSKKYAGRASLPGKMLMLVSFVCQDHCRWRPKTALIPHSKHVVSLYVCLLHEQCAVPTLEPMSFAFIFQWSHHFQHSTDK